MSSKPAAAHAEGPWTAAQFIEGAGGIDPDLSWDGDECYLTWTSNDPNLPAILQARLDLDTGQLREAPRPLWSGSGLAYPEAPHLYHIDDWWYLLIAEGGTERGHAMSLARSRSITGPFDPAPANPIFSHRSLAHSVQNTGHGDFVLTPSGQWAMVYLGVRPKGITPGFHVLGRETFIAGVSWRAGWPIFDEAAFVLNDQATDFVDTFDRKSLHPRWVSPGKFPDRFASLEGEGLTINTPDAGRAQVLTRVTEHNWEACAELDLNDGLAGVVLRVDDDHWCALAATENAIVATHSTRVGEQELARMDRSGQSMTFYIRAVSGAAGFGAHAGPDQIELGVVDGGQHHALASFDGRYLSTEVAGGFTGRMVGVAAYSGRPRIVKFSFGPPLTD